MMVLSVEVLVCWGFDVIAWLRVFCILWLVCCVRCVIFVCMVMVL